MLFRSFKENFNTLQEYSESVTTLSEDIKFYQLLKDSTQNQSAESNLSPKNIVSLISLTNNIKHRITLNHIRFELQNDDESHEATNLLRVGQDPVVSKTFSKKSLKNKTFTCRVVSEPNKDKIAELTISRLMKGSEQSEHCVYYANINIEGHQFHVIVKFAFEDVKKYVSKTTNTQQKGRRYKFMSDMKIKQLERNYSDFTGYLAKLRSTKPNLFADCDVKAVNRIILEIKEQPIFETQMKHYLWVERCIDTKFEHFWNNELRNPREIIVSVTDPFLLNIQKAIYELTSGERTLIDIQGGFKGNVYILSDIEFSDTIPF